MVMMNQLMSAMLFPLRRSHKHTPLTPPAVLVAHAPAGGAAFTRAIPRHQRQCGTHPARSLQGGAATRMGTAQGGCDAQGALRPAWASRMGDSKAQGARVEQGDADGDPQHDAHHAGQGDRPGVQPRADAGQKDHRLYALAQRGCERQQQHLPPPLHPAAALRSTRPRLVGALTGATSAGAWGPSERP